MILQTEMRGSAFVVLKSLSIRFCNAQIHKIHSFIAVDPGIGQPPLPLSRHHRTCLPPQAPNHPVGHIIWLGCAHSFQIVTISSEVLLATEKPSCS